MGSGVVGIERDRLPQGARGLGQLPVVPAGVAERGVGLGRFGIEGEGAFDLGDDALMGRRVALAEAGDDGTARGTLHQPDIRQGAHGAREVGLEGQGAVEQLLRARKTRDGAQIPRLPSLQVELQRLRIHRGGGGGHAQLQRKLLRDAARNFLLHGKDVLRFARESAGPHVKAVGGLDELRGDLHAFTGALHAALDHVGDVELLGDFGNRQVLALEEKRRGAGRHAQAGHLGEHVEQFLAHAVGKILAVARLAEVGEGEHGDGFRGREIRRWLGRGRRRSRCRRRTGRRGRRPKTKIGTEPEHHHRRHRQLPAAPPLACRFRRPPSVLRPLPSDL